MAFRGTGKEKRLSFNLIWNRSLETSWKQKLIISPGVKSSNRNSLINKMLNHLDREDIRGCLSRNWQVSLKTSKSIPFILCMVWLWKATSLLMWQLSYQEYFRVNRIRVSTSSFGLPRMENTLTSLRIMMIFTLRVSSCKRSTGSYDRSPSLAATSL